MGYKLSAARIFFAIVIVNALGFALKYFDLDTHFIFLGFRFHIAAIIPFLIVIKKDHFNLIKESFTKLQFTRIVRVILAFIFSTILFILILFLVKKIKIGDPEYFYEFGLSSIVDYPIYLVWNSIQLMLLYFFLAIIQKRLKYNFIIIFAVSILIFIYEFIPLKKVLLNYESIVAFILVCLIVSVTMKNFNNIYLFIFLIFSSIWVSLLALGSSSSTLVNLFFAANYDSWEGLFTIDKSFPNFLVPAYYLLLLGSLFFMALIKKRKSEWGINNI